VESRCPQWATTGCNNLEQDFQTMKELINAIILFDGICNLCNRAVQFVIKRDRDKKFRLASLQSKPAREILEKFGLPAERFKTFVLICGDQYFTKSTAALKVLNQIGGLWRICYVFIIIPKPIRDFVYDMIARYRYRIFGKRTSCMIPTEDISDRFL
jgi:predicted DCC family thiol-disulfide oxidoreductase YuxK